MSFDKFTQYFQIIFSGGKVLLYELDPAACHDDLATQLTFQCSLCQTATTFPNSPFSEIYPQNYSVNKHLLPMLGPKAYFELVQFVQR